MTPDYIDAAVDRILAAPKPRRAERAEVKVKRPRPSGLKSKIRRTIRDRDDALSLDIHPDDVNAITNALWRLVRPALARAWADGAECGAEAVAACCGCVAPLPPNPYEDPQ